MHNATTTSASLRRALDAFAFSFLALLFLLALMFPARIPGWQGSLQSLTLAGAIYAAAAVITRKLETGLLSTALHTSAVLGLYSFLFQIVAEYQHILVAGWMDASLIEWEKSILGFESSVALQAWVSPPLTEWMMFSYVMYVPLLPILAFVCYRAGGARAATDYLLNLSIAYGVCYIGFIVYPVAGPLFHYPGEFAAPLRGWAFTWCGEWIRSTMHYPGGSLPSPHCAAGTVMMVMLHRYRRDLLFFTLPLFLSIFAATVYGRYHYLTDAVTGVVAAGLVLVFTPGLVRTVDRVFACLKGVFARRTVPESVVK